MVQILEPHFTLHRYSILGSTNDEARRLADIGAAEGAVIWAERQTAGRGRHGRLWVSDPGNLFVSMILRPGAAAARAGELSLLAAVAVAEALNDILVTSGSEAKLHCKWPNDILIDGMKVAGILIDTVAGDGRFIWCVVGIGVNLASSPENMAGQATYLNAHLGDHKAMVSVVEAMQNILPRLWEWYTCWCQPAPGGGFGPVREAWEARAYVPDHPLVVDTGLGRVSGHYDGLDEDGALLLTDSSGMYHRIMAGDVLLNDKV